jgi:hypothetical protein
MIDAEGPFRKLLSHGGIFIVFAHTLKSHTKCSTTLGIRVAMGQHYEQSRLASRLQRENDRSSDEAIYCFIESQIRQTKDYWNFLSLDFVSSLE